MSVVPPSGGRAAALALLGVLLSPPGSAIAAQPAPTALGGTVSTNDASFEALRGFGNDDLRAAFRAFRASCAASKPRSGAAAAPAPPLLASVCAVARRTASARPATARRFFQRYFTVRRVEASGFFTGYYEPVVSGSLVATKRFATPLYGLPNDLVAVAPGTVPGLDATLSAARKLPDGRMVAMPDRAAIETGALGSSARPVAFVERPSEAFFIQVQGSATIRLPDGSTRRLVFAGRNGYPYTSIGKRLVERLGIAPSAMGLSQLKAWIIEHGEREGDAGTRLMRENRSYIFFRADESAPAGSGPVGAEGLRLQPLRSLAIDRTLWPYGLPFYVDTTLADGTPFRRLMISQDTGAAIVGPARADIFFGSGEVAARQAGAMRQSGALFVLWPKPPPDTSSRRRR